MANRQLRIIYRSNSHAPLWLVADKSGSWQKNQDITEIFATRFSDRTDNTG